MNVKAAISGIVSKMGASAMAGAGVLFVAASALGAQERSDLRCERWGGSGEAGLCEVRETRLDAPRGTLDVNGGENGGITVRGWNQDDILVRAEVRTHARRDGRAEALMESVEIVAEGGRIRARGPESERREGWSVSYEIFVPRSMDMVLRANNGGIAIDGVSGEIGFDTQNGGVNLSNLSGDVQGRTVNGGLHIDLSGDRWEGRGLDVETTNGGVTLTIPEDYSAELETGTVNGGLDLDFAVTVRGRISKRIRTELGEGGPPIRVVTTNGGVRIRSR